MALSVSSLMIDLPFHLLALLVGLVLFFVVVICYRLSCYAFLPLLFCAVFAVLCVCPRAPGRHRKHRGTCCSLVGPCVLKRWQVMCPTAATISRQAIAKLTAVGFEPTQLALVELESTPLDHSGKLSLGPRPFGFFAMFGVASPWATIAHEQYREILSDLHSFNRPPASLA